MRGISALPLSRACPDWRVVEEVNHEQPVRNRREPAPDDIDREIRDPENPPLFVVYSVRDVDAEKAM